MNKIIYIITLLILFAIAQKKDASNSHFGEKSKRECCQGELYYCIDVDDSSSLFDLEKQHDCLNWNKLNTDYYFPPFVIFLKKLRRTHKKVGLMLFEADASPPMYIYV